MSFQTIINNATSITVNKLPITSATISRSNRLKTATRGPSIYRFDVLCDRPFDYLTNRDLLEDLNSKNGTVEEEITLSPNASLGYIMSYLGDLSTPDLANIVINSYTGSDLVLSTLAVGTIPSGDVIFTKGDYIQPSNSRYTYNVTAEVTGADVSLDLVTVPVHRNIFDASADGGTSIIGAGLNVANNSTFHVKCLGMPTHTLIPGGFFTFDNAFTFIEVVQ